MKRPEGYSCIVNDERTCAYKAPDRAKFTDFVHRMIRAHILTYYLIISHSAFNFSAASHAYSAGVPDIYPTHQIFLPGLTAHAHINISSFSHAEQQYLMHLHYCKG